jgi:hypothetical protein
MGISNRLGSKRGRSMGIRDRLERLEAGRVKPTFDDRPYRAADGSIRIVFQLEGQSEEEAHRLSEVSHEPIEGCFMITEAVQRSIFVAVNETEAQAEQEADESIAEIRAAQDARRSPD